MNLRWDKPKLALLLIKNHERVTKLEGREI